MLKAFLAIAATLIGVSALLWGFPGAWALTAVVPAFILAATLVHFRRPRDLGGQLRPGVLMLGIVFGLGTGAASVLTMYAASAPEDVVIVEAAVFPTTRAAVWRQLGDPKKRPQWNTWIQEVEDVGRGGEPQVGSTYRADLFLERSHVPHDLVVTELVPEVRFGWSLAPMGGLARLEDMRETIALEDAPGGHTRVTYTLTYAVRSVIARVFERVVIRQSLRKVLEASLLQLEQLATQ